MPPASPRSPEDPTVTPAARTTAGPCPAERRGDAPAGAPPCEIDARIAAVLALRPDCVPGERTLDGRPWIYDLDLRLAYLAREAVAAAPADLSALSDDQLTGLKYAALRRDADARRRDPAAADLLGRVLEERRRRDLRRSAA